MTGIGLCLLPVHYEFSGFDRRGLTAGQIRIGNPLDCFQSLHEAASSAISLPPKDANIGVAPHSLGDFWSVVRHMKRTVDDLKDVI